MTRPTETISLEGGIRKHVLVIQAQSGGFSAGKFAKVTLNDTPITPANNESGHLRGLHMVVVSPSTGKVELAQVFDTYASSEKLDQLIDDAEILRDGSIVIVACSDDCATSLSPKAQTWFSTSLGSKELQHLEYRQSFAIIGTIGS